MGMHYAAMLSYLSCAVEVTKNYHVTRISPIHIERKMSPGWHALRALKEDDY
jgi:hypothetical protein